MKNRDFIITTTNNIEGYAVKRYVETICVNMVLGTNFFSDFSASITDIFGGYSYSYQKKMDLIYKDATSKLKEKAKRKGANCILGFKVDFDEISGKGKSMIMLSASGTACIIEEKEDNKFKVLSEYSIDGAELEREMLRQSIVSGINDGEEIKEEWRTFLLENPQEEIIDNLLDRFIQNSGRTTEEISFITQYLGAIPKEMVTRRAYEKRKENKAVMGDLIVACNLFDSERILLAIKEDLTNSTYLLRTQSDSYDIEDLKRMEEMEHIIDNLPDVGSFISTKGLFSKGEKRQYICPNGHKNDESNEFCEDLNCGLNIKGLFSYQVDSINEFKKKLSSLRTLFNKA